MSLETENAFDGLNSILDTAEEIVNRGHCNRNYPSATKHKLKNSFGGT